MALTRGVGIAVLGCVVLAAGVTGQEPETRTHRGYYAGFGLGTGWHNNTTLDGDALMGGGFYMRVGRSVSQRVLLGFDTVAWVRSENGVRSTRGNVSLGAMVYPSLDGGLYFRGTIGGAVDQVEIPLGNGFSQFEKRYGIGLGAGVGYDIPLGRNPYLTPNFDILIQNIDQVGVGATSINIVTLITVGLTWH